MRRRQIKKKLRKRKKAKCKKINKNNFQGEKEKRWIKKTKAKKEKKEIRILNGSQERKNRWKNSVKSDVACTEGE